MEKPFPKVQGRWEETPDGVTKEQATEVGGSWRRGGTSLGVQWRVGETPSWLVQWDPSGLSDSQHRPRELNTTSGEDAELRPRGEAALTWGLQIYITWQPGQGQEVVRGKG